MEIYIFLTFSVFWRELGIYDYERTHTTHDAQRPRIYIKRHIKALNTHFERLKRLSRYIAPPPPPTGRVGRPSVPHRYFLFFNFF